MIQRDAHLDLVCSEESKTRQVPVHHPLIPRRCLIRVLVGIPAPPRWREIQKLGPLRRRSGREIVVCVTEFQQRAMPEVNLIAERREVLPRTKVDRRGQRAERSQPKSTLIVDVKEEVSKKNI